MYIVIAYDTIEQHILSDIIAKVKMVNIFYDKKIAVLYLTSIFDTDPMNNDDVIDLILDISRKTSQYIILSSDILLTNIFIRYKLNFIHCHIDKDPESYILTSFNILKEKISLIPIIGYSNHSIQNSAGILPIIWHENQLYCGLGLDIKRKQYSDFGGGYDFKYTKHIINNYKNKILGEKQIKDGVIDPLILSDHYCLQPDSHSVLGYGDPNTKYTAFREFIEETSFINSNNEIGYTFDIQNIYEKLYISKSFILLGGNMAYGYDMYLVFLTPDDLLPEIKKIFFKNMHNSTMHKSTHNNSISKKIDSSHIPDIPIIGNNEMYGIDIFNLNYIISNKHILAVMRPCFASAIIKYTGELKFINKHFKLINNLFII
jgi:hypothetical protein